MVDSVQTMSTTEADGVTGGVTQVRAVTTALTTTAKTTGVAMILVGHVTKDGAIAGPRSLEHLVDVVLHFEGDRNSSLRMVRGVKNRFGAADEVGCFLLHDNGIECVADPSGLFLDQRPTPVSGTAVTVTLDGKRPLIGEVQALIGVPTASTPRRAVSGIDSARAAMITAVLEKRAHLTVGACDIYLSTVGGMRLTDPSSDLAVALAIASAYADLPLPTTAVAIGEVGLAGDLRRVSGMERRLAEAARLGFSCAVVPPGVQTRAGGSARDTRPTTSSRHCGCSRTSRTIAAEPRRGDGREVERPGPPATWCSWPGRPCGKPSGAWPPAPRCATGWNAFCAAAPAR